MGQSRYVLDDGPAHRLVQYSVEKEKMDTVRLITTSSCSCGERPSYVLWTTNAASHGSKSSTHGSHTERHVMCNACMTMTRREGKTGYNCVRIYRYCYVPVVHVKHIHALFGVDASLIRSYVHNGFHTCLVHPNQRPNSTLPASCKRPSCQTKMIDSTQYCSILCCVKDTTNQRTETSNYDVDDPDEEIVIDEHVAMYRSAPTTTGRRIRHARKRHRQRKSSPIRSFVL
jgi:hypothetical protein